MKRVAILQSNYIPWKGYFDIINSVDEFIIYDNMQYTRRDWRNRNLIKTSNGLLWLTIPVEVKGKFLQKIRETKISDTQWAKKHWNTIMHNYSKAKYFKDYKDTFAELYLQNTDLYLSDINYKFIKTINEILNIKTSIKWSWEYKVEGNSAEQLINLCKQADANIYLSGPAAKDYIQETKFEKEGIKLIWMDYSSYPEYYQLFPPFLHGVSVLDLIFNEGLNAHKFMKSFV